MIKKYQKGQALIALVVFAVVATTVITGAVAAIIINTQSTGKLAQSEESLKIAESGVEVAVLKLLRNPNYSGESVNIGNGTATITVTGGSTKTIVSAGVEGNFKRTIQTVGSFVDNIFTISTSSEIN
jgi:hypothetical protein